MKPQARVSAALASGAVLVAIAAFTWATGRWVLTAIPIGVLFGFFLQKGDLCGASAFSEVVLAHDWRKVWGLWVAIVISMLGIALGDLMGWVQLNPKPFMWAGVMVGGVVFGIGMVLAGGCISGCLYKGATGNLNSIVAMLTIPLGIAFVNYGPLSSWTAHLKTLKINAANGDSLTLASWTGLPFWLPALAIAALTVAGAVMTRRKHRPGQPRPINGEDESLFVRLFSRPWKPWYAGAAIGLLVLPAYVSSAASGRNYPLGTAEGVIGAALLVAEAPVQHVTTRADAAPAPLPSTGPGAPKRVVWWMVLLVGGMVAGAYLSGRLSGQVRLLPKPPEQILVAIAGGFLVGAGASIGSGCVIGNILSGWALMSIGGVVFGFVTILANWCTTVLYLRGLR